MTDFTDPQQVAALTATQVAALTYNTSLPSEVISGISLSALSGLPIEKLTTD